MICDAPIEYNWFDWHQCTYNGAPYSFMVPHNITVDTKVVVKLAGYSATPYNCTVDSFAQPDAIVVKPCHAHWPDQSLYPGMFGWWGYFIDDRNTARLDVAIDYARSLGAQGDLECTGASYGGTGCLLQSTRFNFTTVRADVPHTLFVKNFPEQAALAWGDNDRDVFDFRLNANENTLYLIGGSPQDAIVNFDLDFFRECDRMRLACVGRWHPNGHSAQGVPQGHPVTRNGVLVAFNGGGVWSANTYAVGLDWVVIKEGHYYLTAETPTTADVTVRRSQLPDGWYNWNGKITYAEGGKFTLKDVDLPTEVQLAPGC